MKMKIFEKQHRLINHGSIILVSSGFEDAANIMAVAWHQVVDVDPVYVSISIGSRRYTHELIEKSGQFGINVPTADQAREIWICGKESGRVSDKFEMCKFTNTPGEMLGVPLIEECIGNMECEVVFKKKFHKHTLYIGEVKAAYIEAGTFDGMWKTELKQITFPFHLGGNIIVRNKTDREKVR